jgi:hypothetical protein
MAKERTLPYLPDQGAPELDFRDWLTGATGCPAGMTFGDFTRHGSDLSDPCSFTLRGGGGEVQTFRTVQRQLANPATIRATLVYATNGLLRPAHLSKIEYEDIWVGLIELSNIIDTRSEADEVWSWLTQYERSCDVVERLSLVARHRLDALLTLQRRPTWGKIQASGDKPAEPGARPVWIVDFTTREQYVRASEFLTFVRHTIGTPISSSTLSSRLREIGGDRVKYEVRSRVDRGLHPRLTFYLMPAEAVEDGSEQ